MDYTLRISGDFEKGDCEKCPLSKKYACLDEDSFFDTYLGCMFQEIEECPLEEVKQGEWKGGIECSNCGQVDWTRPNFCPNCGTDMRGGKE